MPNPAPTQLPAVASAAEKVVYAEQDASNSLVIRSTATERVLACVYTDEDEITQEEWDNTRLICDSINTYDRNQATIAALREALEFALEVLKLNQAITGAIPVCKRGDLIPFAESVLKASEGEG